MNIIVVCFPHLKFSAKLWINALRISNVQLSVKIARVIKPHLKILVVDSLTANDAVQQCRVFNENIGVDGVILTKIDADAKGGAALSIITEIGKPIISIGTGQGYDDLQPFTSDGFINSMLF